MRARDRERERERERERGEEREREREATGNHLVCTQAWGRMASLSFCISDDRRTLRQSGGGEIEVEREKVCVCVCVCVQERERALQCRTGCSMISPADVIPFSQQLLLA